VPDRRHHRGPHPEDLRLFAPESWHVLRQATADLCWLLSRAYPPTSALKLVGDRYDLIARQRTAVGRCACASADAMRRKAHQVDRDRLAGQPLWIDGYNVLTSVEAALAGGVLLLGCDGTYRDMASMHGSFRKVAETLPALEALGRLTADAGVQECVWYLDRPVSNSGRLGKIIEELAAANGWPWRAELVQNPDPVLAETTQIVATADSVILDRCHAWFNLARETIARHVSQATVVDLVA
jgi:hypothetical protein